MQFFTSDIHFCDDGNLVVDGRPFKNYKKFDKYVIKMWNKDAKKGDIIYVVGDFVDCNNQENKTYLTCLNYIKKIKAQVVLIMGNNEERVVKFFFNNNFESFRKYCINLGFRDVYKTYTIQINNIPFHLVHKPKHYNPNMLNLFGHVHRSGGLYRPFGINVGCDLNHFKLYSENDILRLLKLKHTYWDIDQNLNLWPTECVKWKLPKVFIDGKLL